MLNKILMMLGIALSLFACGQIQNQSEVNRAYYQCKNARANQKIYLYIKGAGSEWFATISGSTAVQAKNICNFFNGECRVAAQLNGVGSSCYISNK